MTKSELIEQLSKKQPHLALQDVELAVKCILIVSVCLVLVLLLDFYYTNPIAGFGVSIRCLLYMFSG